MATGNSEWTIETLRMFFLMQLDNHISATDERYRIQEQRIDAAFKHNKEVVDRALASADRAIEKNQASLDHRFEAINEFRGVLADQAATFITRGEYESAHHVLEERLQGLAEKVTLSQGKGQGLAAGWVYLLGLVSLVSTIFAIIFALKI